MNIVGKQKGMTTIGWVFVIMLIAIVTLFALRLIPIYIDGFSVASSLESLKNEHGLAKKSPTYIKNTLLKRFDINSVRDVTKDDIYIEHANGMMTIEVDYEVRQKLVGNLDIVVVFLEKIEVPAN